MYRGVNEIKDLIAVFSFDYKSGYEDVFMQSLALVKDEEVFVKLVLLPGQPAKEIMMVAEKIASINKDIPLIIQPVTPHKKIKHMPTGQEIISAYAIAKKKLNEVRVIPQTHKLMHLQ